MYITGGFNCYPAEIERLMSAHPAIGQIAVIGVRDERHGRSRQGVHRSCAPA